MSFYLIFRVYLNHSKNIHSSWSWHCWHPQHPRHMDRIWITTVPRATLKSKSIQPRTTTAMRQPVKPWWKMVTRSGNLEISVEKPLKFDRYPHFHHENGQNLVISPVWNTYNSWIFLISLSFQICGATYVSWSNSYLFGGLKIKPVNSSRDGQHLEKAQSQTASLFVAREVRQHNSS